MVPSNLPCCVFKRKRLPVLKTSSHSLTTLLRNFSTILFKRLSMFVIREARTLLYELWQKRWSCLPTASMNIKFWTAVVNQVNKILGRSKVTGSEKSVEKLRKKKQKSFLRGRTCDFEITDRTRQTKQGFILRFAELRMLELYKFLCKSWQKYEEKELYTHSLFSALAELQICM